MGLKDLRSNLDIYGGNQAIGQGGSPGGTLSNPNPPYDGGAYLAQGPKVGEQDYDFDFYRDSGNSSSPFDFESNGSYPTSDDQLVAMLERRSVSSTNTDPLGPLGSSTVTNPMIYSPTPGGNGQGTLDENMNMNNGVSGLQNAQYGNGLFADKDSLGAGSKKTINGVDLHVALLQNSYTSTNTSANYNGTNYAAGQPTSVYPTINPSPVTRDQDNFQDLNTTEGGIGNAPGFARFQNPFTNPSMEPESPNVIDTPSEQGLAGIYNSTVNPNSNTNGNWPTPQQSLLDLSAQSSPSIPGGINDSNPTKYQDIMPT